MICLSARVNQRTTPFPRNSSPVYAQGMTLLAFLENRPAQAPNLLQRLRANPDGGASPEKPIPLVNLAQLERVVATGVPTFLWVVSARIGPMAGDPLVGAIGARVMNDPPEAARAM